ncbi:M20/M25/M40 family metallo-hydrolase [Aliikangiella coralliicola]|uniref:M20/M25/M40 family metallo-hydrolase n=1 Tax=Aliikangiella coralliicola TaxID=2592383 RepID=A0A545UAS3_9GAMM|nr:M20/M25/M40 family metallo-hydrolase [Aliikangiella coralliicola]TQV86566.1 M20/M25/M40 family metallo-hydrolase [Aliikangiella coralliicola]
MKKINAFSTGLKPVLMVLFFSYFQNAVASSISLENVTKDVTFLADDKLGGRATDTAGIELAADYISQRFNQIGLQSLSGDKNFKQTFNLFLIKPDDSKISLNGSSIANDKAMILTSHESLKWSEKSNVKTFVISAEDNFRKRIFEINQQKDNVLVLVDESHAEIFNRFRNHFGNGLNKFKINQGPSAVAILTKLSKLDSFSISAKSNISTRSLSNVVGILPGKKNKEEMILFSAHYDHLGTVEDQKGDNIYNGADDDASGTAAVINLAEYFTKQKNNQRTLMFVAFTAEEIGGFGSKYFSQQLNADKVLAMINIEMIGKPSKFGAGEFWMTGYERSNLAEILDKNLKRINKKVYPDPYPQQQLFYRSDNATLARLGVPAHSFSSSQIDKDHYYHKVTDEVKTLDLKSMHAIIESLANGVESLVDGTDTPTRVDTSQVNKQGSFF